MDKAVGTSCQLASRPAGPAAEIMPVVELKLYGLSLPTTPFWCLVTNVIVLILYYFSKEPHSQLYKAQDSQKLDLSLGWGELSLTLGLSLCCVCHHQNSKTPVCFSLKNRLCPCVCPVLQLNLSSHWELLTLQVRGREAHRGIAVWGTSWSPDISME